MGFYRNLSVGEIIFQVKQLNTLSKTTYGHHLSNIVFMGMGEPLLNYRSVMRAASLLTIPEGLKMSPQRITISTVGIVPKIRQMADEKVKFNLAVSLHTASDKTRNSLIPINQSYSLEKLQDAIKYFYTKTGNRVTLEYLLMKDINDSEKDAKALTEFTKAFPCKINVIEYNPVEGLPFERPEKNRFEQFINHLKSKNLIVMVRRSRGKDIDAACGQLATKVI
jgi:23S rRNA (adenine2503-C2)-methyltransferase